MIKKQTAEQSGIKTIDSSDMLTDEKQALIEKLKRLLPNVINADNQLDVKALSDAVDIKNTTSNNQGYELTFAGKGIARALADQPTDLELKAEPSQSKDFNTTNNTVIRGDNLEVLKILQANYHKKVKMIYIDPPYNTKSENFIYKDNFKQSDETLINNFGLNEEATDFLHNVYGTRSHSGWLSFIYPRLKLARDLLTDDGVIFISIDDSEQANLKILCDEIFGEDNFVGDFVWKTRQASGKQISDNNTSIEHEHIFCFQKKESLKFLGVSRDRKNYTNPDNDPRGDWAKHPLDVGATKDERPNCFYDLIDPKTEKVYPANPNRVWSFSQDSMKQLLDNRQILFHPEGRTKPYLKKFWKDLKSEFKPISSWLDKQVFDIGYNTEGTKQVNNLFDGKKIFDYPKPVSIVQILIGQTASQNDIVLDFFAGSGTTADAVMQLNAQDGGNRRFVLVQIDEPIDKKKSAEAYKFCTENDFQPVISSITIERLNRAGEKIKGDFAQNQKGLFDDKKLPDIGYKVFSCTKKPIVSERDDIFAVENHRTNTLDTLANMLVATCKTLDTPIDCLLEDKLYQADNEIYLLANVEHEVLAKYNDFKINLDGWADIDLTQYLNLGVGQADNISVIY